MYLNIQMYVLYIYIEALYIYCRLKTYHAGQLENPVFCFYHIFTKICNVKNLSSEVFSLQTLTLSSNFLKKQIIFLWDFEKNLNLETFFTR